MVKEAREEEIIATLSTCDSISDAKQYYHELLTLKERSEKDTQKHRMKEILVAFGDENRFLILDMLRQKDRCVCELEAIIQKTQPAISHHLKILENAHLIQGWKKGKFTHYSLVKENFEEFLRLWYAWVKDISNWFGTIPSKNII
jgi:ArsR family transcriptional regulator, arsenate/arsenite/antimonite-responsive transcriptional repressor